MAVITEKLPNEPIWNLLLAALELYPRHVVVTDSLNRLEADYAQLVTDMLYMRREITKALPPSMFDSYGRIAQDRPYITIIAPGNFDFIVAAFAVLSLGGAFMPISTNLTPEEVNYLLQMADSTCLLVSSCYLDKATQVQEYYHTAAGRTMPVIPIQVKNRCTDPKPQIQIDQAAIIDPMSPSLLIFTSGTTGPPKGVVRPRHVWYIAPPCFPSNEAFLVFRPPHSVSVALRFMWHVQRGSRVHVIPNRNEIIWERFRNEDVTVFSASPRKYADMMKYFRENIDGLPDGPRAKYIKGVRRLRTAEVSGGVTWPTVAEFWYQILGKPLQNTYSSTEVTCAIRTTENTDPKIERCIGKPRPGVQVKLSHGDHGEILLKSPDMLTSYIGDEAATRACLDDEGYYKTGDLGRLVGEQYVFEGRASSDWIRNGSLKVPVHEVEACLVSLPYISEAYLVYASLNYTDQLATLVRLTGTREKVSLSMIRADLQDRLHHYKLPTLLRILQPSDVVPDTGTGKACRRTIAKEYFSISQDLPLDAAIEFCDETPAQEGAPQKPWNWGGVR